MPSILVLVGTFGFSGFLLWKSRLETAGVSAATWITTLWMMRCASRSLNLWFYPVQRGDTVWDVDVLASLSDTPYDQIVLAVLTMLAVAALVSRRGRVNILVADNRPLLLLFGYMLVSTMWSPEPAISVKRWLLTVGDLAAVLIVLSEPRRLAAVSAVFSRCFAILVPLSIVLSKYYPIYGRARSKHWLPDTWIGVATHKNTLAELAMLAALFYTWQMLSQRPFQIVWKRDWRNLLMLAMSLFLLRADGDLSVSTTAVLAFILGTVLLLSLRRSAGLNRGLLRVFVLLVLGLGFASAVTGVALTSWAFGSIGELAGKDSTLTGRTLLWQALIELANEHPLLGVGFGAFWDSDSARALAERPDMSWGPGQAHNGYLELYLNLGLIGLALLGAVAWRGLKRILGTLERNSQLGAFMLVLFIITIVYNLSEGAFGRPTHLIWFVFLLTMAGVGMRGRGLERPAAPAARGAVGDVR